MRRRGLVESTSFGHGWISGVVSVTCGAMGLAAVVCFYFPSYLTMPELRDVYPMEYVRALLHLVLLAGFLSGMLSVVLRHSKVLGLSGLALTLTAVLIGGSTVELEGPVARGVPFLGLDWFLWNLLGYSLVFIPIERVFGRVPQAIFRASWRTDLTYFMVSTLLVQLTSLLTMKPAMVFFGWAAHPGVQAWVAGLPFLAQFAGILVVSDLTQDRVHRTFHRVGWLWRVHAIHHSAESMDWLAGSRLHLVDVAVTRGLTYVPIYVLGFSQAPLIAYIAFVSAQATFIHANVRWTFGPLRWVLATPQFHHWHHAAEREAIDKNFAVHLPVIDWLFGTYYQPEGRWPGAYGLADGTRIGGGYVSQFLQPFRRSLRTDAPVSDEPPAPGVS